MTPELTIAERRILRAMIDAGGKMGTRGRQDVLTALEQRGLIRVSAVAHSASGGELITHEITQAGRRAVGA